jgi:hypothetical protein
MIAARGRAYEGARTIFFLWLDRNPLKSPESDEEIQIIPKKSKPDFLGFSWPGLVRLGKIWPEAHAAAASASGHHHVRS